MTSAPVYVSASGDVRRAVRDPRRALTPKRTWPSRSAPRHGTAGRAGRIPRSSQFGESFLMRVRPLASVGSKAVACELDHRRNYDVVAGRFSTAERDRSPKALKCQRRLVGLWQALRCCTDELQPTAAGRRRRGPMAGRMASVQRASFREQFHAVANRNHGRAVGALLAQPGDLFRMIVGGGWHDHVIRAVWVGAVCYEQVAPPPCHPALLPALMPRLPWNVVVERVDAGLPRETTYVKRHTRHVSSSYATQGRRLTLSGSCKRQHPPTIFQETAT